jgi:hypothetical protein
MNTSEIRTLLATAELDADVTTQLEALLAGGADLTDAELEAVVGGKEFLGAFAGGMAGYGGGFGGYQRRSLGNTGFGSANRAIASMSRNTSNNIRSMTNNFTRSVLRR